MADLPEQGWLAEHSLPRLLVELHRAGFGGALTLSRERVGKRFLFRSGVPVFAESNLASESLGVQLMDAGHITRPDYNRVVRHIESRGCKEGTALLELGLLQPKELFEALKDQVRIRIVECFGWPQGEFYLDASVEPGEDAQPFRADLYALLQEGLEAHWSTDRVLGDLGPRMEEYPRPGARFERVATRLRRDQAVETLIEALDGSRSLWKLVQVANTPRALAAAWVLDAADALDYAHAPQQDGDAPDTFDRNVEIVVDASRALRASRESGGKSGRSVERARASNAAAAEKLRGEVDARYENLRNLDHYALLSVASDAATAEIKHAYLAAAKQYHPDALARAGLDGDTRAKANDVFAAISKAHVVLTDPGRREDYDLSQRSSDSDLDANRLAQAETNFRKAEILMRTGNFRGALEYLASSVELWPDECAYQSAYGWCLYKQPASDPEKAREHLENAERLDSDDAETQFRLSVVLRSLGDSDAAGEAARRAEQLGS